MIGVGGAGFEKNRPFFAFVRKVFRLQEIILAVAAMGQVKCWLGANVRPLGQVKCWLGANVRQVCSSLGQATCWLGANVRRWGKSSVGWVPMFVRCMFVVGAAQVLVVERAWRGTE